MIMMMMIMIRMLLAVKGAVLSGVLSLSCLLFILQNGLHAVRGIIDLFTRARERFVVQCVV
jgi:hypothetical protein